MSNWKAQPLSKFTRSSPNLRLIDACLKVYFGFFFNGCYGVRAIRGGSSYSIHSWGAAIDSSWRNSNRGKSLEAIAWLVENSEELRIESVHDYKGSRIWHADRSTPNDVATARQDGAVGGGWKRNTGSGMGSGDWIHYETTLAGWGDETPIGLRPGLKLPGATEAAPLGECKCNEVEEAKAPEWPVFAPKSGKFGLWPLADKPDLKPDLTKAQKADPQINDATLYLQGVLKKNGYAVAVDGDYGPKTQAVAKKFQAANSLGADGWVGAKTWAKIDAAA